MIQEGAFDSRRRAEIQDSGEQLCKFIVSLGSSFIISGRSFIRNRFPGVFEMWSSVI